MGDTGKQAPAPQTPPKEGEPKFPQPRPGTEAGCPQPGPAGEETPPGLGSAPARAREGKRGRLEASVPEGPGAPRPSLESPAAHLALHAPLRRSPCEHVLLPPSARGAAPRRAETRGSPQDWAPGAGAPAFSAALRAPPPPRDPGLGLRREPAFPRSVCYLAPATENIKQKNFRKLSSPDTPVLLRSGPHLLTPSSPPTRKAS